MKINKAIVIGADATALELACLLANWEILTMVLHADPAAARNLREQALRDPHMLFHPDRGAFLQAGGLRQQGELLGRADVVLECVPDEQEAKSAVYGFIADKLTEKALIFSCSPAWSLAQCREAAPPALRSRLVKLHFTLPTRAHALVEMCTDGAAPGVQGRSRDLLARRLGRVPVSRADGHGSFVERLELQFLRQLVSLLSKGLADIEEIEFFAGPILGFPAGGGLAKIDAMGVHTFSGLLERHAAAHPGAADQWTRPSLLERMIELGHQGGPTAHGFYMRGEEGTSCFRMDTHAHTPYRRVRLEELEACLEIESFHMRIRALLKDGSHYAGIAWRILRNYLTSSIAVFPDVCDSTADFDLALREGLGVHMGPFELWEALGFEDIWERLEKDAVRLPPWLVRMREAGLTSFFSLKGRRNILSISHEGHAVELEAPPLHLFHVKRQYEAVERNAHGSLYNLGDGVFGMEIHSPRNAITPHLLEMLAASLQRVNAEGIGLVLAVEGRNFSAGTDYGTLLGLARQKKFEPLRRVIRQRQAVNSLVKYSAQPVVCAARGLTLGAGLELAWHCAQVHGEPNLMAGYDEVQMGLIPMGGGCKEVVLRSSRERRTLAEMETELLARFEWIVSGQVSASFAQARAAKLLNSSDTLSRGTSTHLQLAKSEVLRLYSLGYAPPQENTILTVPGRSSLAVLEQAVLLWEKTGRLDRHRAGAARQLAQVLVGGQASHPSRMSEEALLELEAETALSLLGRAETLDILEKAAGGGA